MQRSGVGQFILLTVLMVLLILTAIWAVTVWNASSGVPMDKHGWIAVGLGTFFAASWP
jgi:hypothetical protein